jgi:hypothetical protein
VENSTLEDEPRVTFDYFRVIEEMPDTHLKLSSKVHDNLSDSRHQCLFSTDLKHAYLIISMHSENRHYFAFTIFGIDQIQLTRMQQESKSAEFFMTEIVYRAFDQLSSPIKESSLLHFEDSMHLSVLTFYMNDFFDEFKSFDELYEFLREHFLSRIEWAKLKLAFKKLKIAEKKLKTLKVTHAIDDFIHILEQRIKKIAT